MDFSTEFVAFRDRLQEGQDEAFVSRRNVEVAGRTAALLSSFSVSSERKILGIMPTGSTTHAHEYRLLFAAPDLEEAALDGWWDIRRGGRGRAGARRTHSTAFPWFR